MRETIKELREDFGPKFFASRERLKADLAGWLALHSLFDQSLAVLDFDFPPFFVVTTKDENSVMRLAEFNGYNDKILGVYGKEVATDKRISFQKLFADRNELQPPENYIFVDDNIVHLQQVSDLSVQCWLASWGYVDPEAIGEFPQLDSLADLKKVVD
jgi:phosphoglycolate phosphatase-like HAD superfamily hydrolase